MNEMTIVENANAAWNNAFNSKDIDALVELYSNSAVLSPGNGEFLTGHEEIKGLFKSFIDGGMNSHTLEVVKVEAFDDVIYQVAKWSVKGPEVDGMKPIFTGITTNVLNKTAENKWLVKSHVWNAKS